MNKTEIIKLIERITENGKYDSGIGRVLELMAGRGVLYDHFIDSFEGHDNVTWLVSHWGECGYAKSLNQIVEESGWETIKKFSENEQMKTMEMNYILKDPNARELFDFIEKLNLIS